MSRDALNNLKKLPPSCFGLLGGRPVQIHRGGSRSINVSVPTSLIDTRNAEMGITPEQRAAMEAGLVFGWDSDAADPDSHRPKGETKTPFCEWAITFPMIACCRVVAQSEERALELATRWLDDLSLPDAVSPDGEPDFTEVKRV